MTIRECVDAFCRAWFEQRDIEKTVGLLADEVNYAGPGECENAHGKTEMILYMHLSNADAATIPIIAMTANAFEEDIERCKAAGMNAHLAKPIDPDRLYQTLNDYIFKEETDGFLDAPKVVL